MRLRYYVVFAALTMTACNEERSAPVAETPNAPIASVANAPSFGDPKLVIAGESTPLTQGEMVDAIAIMPGETISQSFQACNSFSGVTVTIVTWNHQPDAYSIAWKLRDGAGSEIGAGLFDASTLVDWQKLSMPATGAAGPHTLELSSPAGTNVVNPAGTVVAAPIAASTPVAAKNGLPVPKPGALQVSVVGTAAAPCPPASAAQ